MEIIYVENTGHNDIDRFTVRLVDFEEETLTLKAKNQRSCSYSVNTTNADVKFELMNNENRDSEKESDFNKSCNEFLKDLFVEKEDLKKRDDDKLYLGDKVSISHMLSLLFAIIYEYNIDFKNIKSEDLIKIIDCSYKHVVGDDNNDEIMYMNLPRSSYYIIFEILEKYLLFFKFKNPDDMKNILTQEVYDRVESIDE